MNYESAVTAENADRVASEPLGGVYQEDDAGEGRVRVRRWAIIAAAIVLGLAVAGFAISFLFGGDDAGDNESQMPVVSVIVPGATTAQSQISATGTIAARRPMPVGVVGEGGRVASVLVDAGDWVNKGQVLAVIDRSVQSQEAKGAAAQVRVAQADANLAQANLDRALQLVDRGFISKADVDRLTATRDAAAARVDVAQAQYRELLARNSRLNIVAPADGLILDRKVERGQTVSSGSGTLFLIARDGQLEMRAKVSEADLAKLSVGERASVVPVGTNKKFVGQIWQLSPMIAEDTRQGTARIALSYAPELRPGGFATATIIAGTINAPILPDSAILSDDKGSYVYIVDKDGKAQRRAIETGIVTEEGIAVSKGLTGTERVVLRAGGFLTEGESVEPRKVTPNEG